MISIIVPCYNEQEALPLFHKEITRVLQEMGESYELLLVNDGSRDNTLDVMRTLAQEDGHVVYLSFSRNFGKEAAMYAGFCNAQGGLRCCNGRRSARSTRFAAQDAGAAADR